MITMASLEIARIFKKDIGALREAVDLILDGYLLGKKIYSTENADMTFLMCLAESMNFSIHNGYRNSEGKWYLKVRPSRNPINHWQISYDNKPVVHVTRDESGLVSVGKK